MQIDQFLKVNLIGNQSLFVLETFLQNFYLLDFFFFIKLGQKLIQNFKLTLKLSITQAKSQLLNIPVLEKQQDFFIIFQIFLLDLVLNCSIQFPHVQLIILKVLLIEPQSSPAYKINVFQNFLFYLQNGRFKCWSFCYLFKLAKGFCKILCHTFSISFTTSLFGGRSAIPLQRKSKLQRKTSNHFYIIDEKQALKSMNLMNNWFLFEEPVFLSLIMIIGQNWLLGKLH